MGRDKALLPYRGTTLLEHAAREVLAATGVVTVIGDPERYSRFGFPVVADRIPGFGPLSGIHTALSITQADWNLVVACDMPAISPELLRALMACAARSGRDCVAAAGRGGEPEPLCAVYHRRSLAVLEQALKEKRLKMRDLLPELGAETCAVELAALANVNTPDEWEEFAEQPL
jgi:molybdenum cofactor guanylyltransferase